MTPISNIWKQLTSILSNLNNFHSLEVVDRVSETQLQVGENSNWIIWLLKCWTLYFHVGSYLVNDGPLLYHHALSCLKENRRQERIALERQLEEDQRAQAEQAAHAAANKQHLIDFVAQVCEKRLCCVILSLITNVCTGDWKPLKCLIYAKNHDTIKPFCPHINVVFAVLKVIYHPLYSMNNFVTNKSKLPQDGAQVPYKGIIIHIIYGVIDHL